MRIEYADTRLTNEQTNVHDTRGRRHVELDILQACSLGSRPVDTCTCCTGGHICRVDDKVANLAVKVVHGNPVQVFRVVGIAIDQAKSREICGSLESWGAPSISDEHSKVIRDNRRGDEVCASWEVDHSRGNGSRSLRSVSWDGWSPWASLGESHHIHIPSRNDSPQP